MLSLESKQNKHTVPYTTVFAKLEGLLVANWKIMLERDPIALDSKVKYAKVRYMTFSVA